MEIVERGQHRSNLSKDTESSPHTFVMTASVQRWRLEMENHPSWKIMIDLAERYIEEEEHNAQKEKYLYPDKTTEKVEEEDAQKQKRLDNTTENEVEEVEEEVEKGDGKMTSVTANEDPASDAEKLKAQYKKLRSQYKKCKKKWLKKTGGTSKKSLKVKQK